MRDGQVMRSLMRITALASVATMLFACGGSASNSAQSTPAGPNGEIRIASYDFTESVLLAEIYAIALRDDGARVRVVADLGSREVVDPALMQGEVDVVPEYTGTALSFLTGVATPSAISARDTSKRLRRAFAARRVVTLNYSPAEDQNGYVVATRAAVRHHWNRISDLRPDAASLVFGGPPECVERPLCLVGLRNVYGLHFRSFRSFGDQSVTAQALLSGEIDVGLLDTTNGALANPGLRLLRDDRRLQPVENVVPAVNSAAFARDAPRLTRVLNGVSARLHTSDLAEMNRAVDVGGRSPHAVAEEWLRQARLLTGSK
jgi:osmoprotectant transport system substrate-binding protein